MAQPVGLSFLWPTQPILYSLSIAAVLIPAPAHFKSGNPGVILLACWILACQSILLIDSIIWRGNTNNNLPYYCDLTTAIFAVAPTGFSASALCITRQLHRLAKAQAVIITKAQKRKELFIDLSIGLGIPILVLGGHAIVQGHRYDIFEDWGCVPTTYNVTLAYPLYVMWPLLISVISSAFGLLALRQFLKRRRTFEILLSSNGTGMQKNRYLRLMWLCCADLMVSIPYHIYNIVDVSTNQTVYPWVSWAVTQADWYHVDFFRRILIDETPYLRVPMVLIMSLTCFLAFMFFLLFGFTRETTKFYRNTYYWCMKPFGIKKPQRTTHIVNAPPKRTWLDKLLRRETVPLNSFNNTTGSMPVFSSQDRSIPTGHEKTMTMTTSAIDTLDWENGSRVLVINGRLSIPGLRNGLSSFDPLEFDEQKEKTPRTPSTSTSEDEHRKPCRSPV